MVTGTKTDIDIWGGISTSICTWSAHISACTIFTFFLLHSIGSFRFMQVELLSSSMFVSHPSRLKRQ